jgi:hypothetical protein
MSEFLLAEAEPSISIASILIPLLSRIRLEQIKVPERANLDLLFRLDCLWCTPILHNHKVIELLRDSPLSAAQRLLSCLPENSDLERMNHLFAEYPHAFAAMLDHFSDLVGPKPRSLVEAHQILQQRQRELADCPRFVKTSVAFLAKKSGQDLANFAFWIGDFEWSQCFLFFAICSSQYEQAVRLIDSQPSLINFLGQPMPEEMLFVGAGKWTDSLVLFAVHCLHQSVSFAGLPDWKRFLGRIKAANWPDGLTVNHVNLLLLDKALV